MFVIFKRKLTFIDLVYFPSYQWLTNRETNQVTRQTTEATTPITLTKFVLFNIGFTIISPALQDSLLFLSGSKITFLHNRKFWEIFSKQRIRLLIIETNTLVIKNIWDIFLTSTFKLLYHTYIFYCSIYVICTDHITVLHNYFTRPFTRSSAAWLL